MTCHVILSNTQDLYYPGQMVSGIVVCTFHADKYIRAIRVKLRGKELTDYAERDKYFDKVEKKVKYEDIHYMGANRFLEIVHDLVGEGIMAMGRYEYPFYFTLPLDIPSSYEGTYAYIRYYIKANVDIPFAIDYSGKTNFEVHSPIDFNRFLSEIPMSPVTYQIQKTLGFCCCASKPITMTINLPKEAFVEGEIARIGVDVANMAEENVVQVIIKITRTIEARSFRKHTQYKKDKLVLVSAVETGVGANGQRNYDFHLPIPKTGMVYNFIGCQNLKQWFTLSVEAVLPNFHTNMKIKTKLILGHIPLGGLHEFRGDARPGAASRVSSGLPPPF